MKKKTKLIIGIAVLLILAANLLLIPKLRSVIGEQPNEQAGQAAHADRKPIQLEYNGETRFFNHSVDSVLLLGLDSNDPVVDSSDEDADFYNHIQADVIVLLAIDNENKTVTPIQFNRDTMTEVIWLDILGEVGGTNTEQLALSYNSGSGGTDSCQVTRDTLSLMLFNMPIDNYLAFTMSGITTLNDLVGGVTVEIIDDLTPVDPTLIPGTTVTLKGEHAENYIRARMILKDDTNLARMRRHREYFDGFMTSARTRFNSDSDFLMDALEKLQPYMLTDLSAQKLSDLAEKLDTYDILPVRTIAGELKTGEEYYEFYRDEQDLWSTVSSCFCK